MLILPNLLSLSLCRSRYLGMSQASFPNICRVCRQKSQSPPKPRFRRLSLAITAQTSTSMNALPPASLGRTHSSGGSVGNASTTTALTSPTSTKGKRRRIPDVDSSPGSAEDGYDANEDKRRPPGVKRACNECRQQKVVLEMAGV